MPLTRDSFKPALYKESAEDVIYLPCPVINVALPAGWKHDKRQGAWADTASAYGHSKETQQFSLTGLFGNQNGSKLHTEALMWDASEAIRAYLDLDPGETLEFFVYYDEGQSLYRKYKSMLPILWTPSVGDDNFAAWTWQLTLDSLDPVIYSTAPGE